MGKGIVHAGHPLQQRLAVLVDVPHRQLPLVQRGRRAARVVDRHRHRCLEQVVFGASRPHANLGVLRRRNREREFLREEHGADRDQDARVAEGEQSTERTDPRRDGSRRRRWACDQRRISCARVREQRHERGTASGASTDIDRAGRRRDIA